MDANICLQRILLGNKRGEKERKGGRKGEVVNKIQPPSSHPQRLTSCYLVPPLSFCHSQVVCHFINASWISLATRSAPS